MSGEVRVWALHLAVLVLIAAALAGLPAYHSNVLARVLVLAVFAMGYNIAFGYTGLLSLGHALFFAAGMYGAGLGAQAWGLPAGAALVAGALAGAAMAAAVGVLALRTAGVSFMIVTLMFAQAGYLTVLYFGPVTGGDEGFIIADASRVLFGANLSEDGPRAVAAFVIFALALVACVALVRSRHGRVLVAMRENEERSRMLGYDPFRVKLGALALSGLYAGAAGAAYAVLFGYVGANFATIQYSILPLLYVLLGGAGVVLGPFLGALIIFYLVDITPLIDNALRYYVYESSTPLITHLMVVGVALVVLVLFAPRGILGSLRERALRWLP